MNIKTSELTGAALDWAVEKCIYMQHSLESDFCGSVGYARKYSTDWAQGGPIIEREGIALLPPQLAEMPGYEGRGETLLIAAMRCYVASKLGDEVDVPEEMTE